MSLHARVSQASAYVGGETCPGTNMALGAKRGLAVEPPMPTPPLKEVQDIANFITNNIPRHQWPGFLADVRRLLTDELTVQHKATLSREEDFRRESVEIADILASF